MKLPCDLCMWGLIPMIKREVVLRLLEGHKLSQAAISRKLGITKGSITQYVQGQRAKNSANLRQYKKLNKLIVDWSKELATKKFSEKMLAKKFCEVCKVAQKSTGVC